MCGIERLCNFWLTLVFHTIIRYRVSIYFLFPQCNVIYTINNIVDLKRWGKPIWLTFSPIWCLDDGWQWTFILNEYKWDKYSILQHYKFHNLHDLPLFIETLKLMFARMMLLRTIAWCQHSYLLKIALFLGGWYLGCSSTTLWSISLLFISDYC